MRILEIILILINFLTLFLSLKKWSKVIRRGVAGVNLSVFLIHGILEGLRYQMIFSYIFVVIFVIYTLVKTSDKFLKIKIPKGIKIIAVSLVFVSLIITSILSYVLPVFEIPKPTGSYNVGVNYLHLVDENRNDPFLDKSTKKRELMVKVYYPANKDDSKQFERYFNNSSELIKQFAVGYGMPDFIFSHLNLVKTNSKIGLEISDKEQNYPVILFSHGGGTSMEVQTSQCEDLASQGYIVAAIDHTYVSKATIFPDRAVSEREATTNFNIVEPAEIITEIMTDDSQFVIDSLIEMNNGKITSIFKGRLDLNRIGAIGHSVGGATAYNLAINDSRVRAAINLDGRVFITPKENLENMAPFLMITNDKDIQMIANGEGFLKKFEDLTDEERKNIISMYGSMENYNEAYRKEHENTSGLIRVLKESENLFSIEGSNHMKFTDIGLFIDSDQLRELIGISGKTTPERCLNITKSVTSAFFEMHLKEEEKGQLNILTKEYSELKKVELK
ncbi:alpha/beta fold hydrolase [Clostridium sp. AL.422]|uniref:alpha/beta hydrolase family protein n=1 Tax=Clostridium TaxID=1485 RepID=UPI00293DF2C5|nr:MULTISPECIES: alpha/beta fold hydrolase [unclassified Clostridium]MDV4151340.1 alpha/beta fold hydrolase [Clostridium sp. AL.422]